MRTLVLALVSLLFPLACTPAGSDTDASSGEGEAQEAAASEEPRHEFDDPEVTRIWDRMMKEIAPNDGWARTRYLQFDWIVDRGETELVRSHRWDVWNGDYRVEAPVGDGSTMVALFNVNDPTGTERIWIDGERVEDARSDSLAQRANGMFVNDSYWLVMPFKWADPGVTATYVGEMEEWGDTYEVVELTFDAVGLTPQNKYRAFVNPESGIMELWQHFRSADDTEPSFTMAWTDWEDHGPIWLSSRRENREGEATIYFQDLRAETTLPTGVFVSPGG